MSSHLLPEYGPHVPEDKDQYLVNTPYGPGLVIRTSTRRLRNNNNNNNNTSRHRSTTTTTVMREIILTGWSNNSHITTDSSCPTNYDDSISATTPTTTTTTTTTNNNDSNSSNNNNNNNDGRPIRPTMLYTSIDYPMIDPVVGSDVICSYGRGRVIEIRRQEEQQQQQPNCTTTTSNSFMNTGNSMMMIVVQLSSWRLTQRNRVLCYMNLQSVRTVRHKYIYEMSIVEKIEYATHVLKRYGSLYYTKKLYTMANQYYVLAIDTVKYVQHQYHHVMDSSSTTNQTRADLLLLMMTCCNNTATCYYMQQQQQQENNNNNTKEQQPNNNDNYEKTYQYAQQALSLIEALEIKKNGKIYAEIRKTMEFGNDDYHPTTGSRNTTTTTTTTTTCTTDIRIFGEWKIKALYNIARVLYEKHDDVTTAMSIIKQARDIIVTYTTLTTTATATATTITNTKNENGVGKGGMGHETPSSSLSAQYQSIQLLLRKNDRDFIKLYHKCKERQKELYKIEKLRAQAMFAVVPDATSSSSCTTNKNNKNSKQEQQVEGKQLDRSSVISKTLLDSNSHGSITNNDDDDDDIASSIGHCHRRLQNNHTTTTNNNKDIVDFVDTTVTTNETDDDLQQQQQLLPWYNDPYLLGGLSFVMGMIGTTLLIITSRSTTKIGTSSSNI